MSLPLFPAPAPPTTPEDVTRRALALRAAFEAEPGDRALRIRSEEALAELRALWRERAELFDEEAVAALRALSEALRRPVRRARTDATTPREVLRSVFGYESFRPGQEAVIEAVLSGRDCVAVMPTGAGKSLTYQIPARILGGTTLVLSPLIALMKDQVDAMNRVGIRATFLNSSVGPEERRARVEALRRGELEIVYAAPEGLEASAGSALSDVPLSLIAVDEAHCISHWGHDFRPAYRNLSGLKTRFGGIPVLALTATATREVTRDIVRQLAMERPHEHRGSFFRSNLHIHAYKKGDGARVGTRDAILRLVRARRGESGIVYCLSRKAVEATAEFLESHGVRARAYHAGLDADTRTRVQDAFQEDAIDVVVATVAFGMGIDKPAIRYVIHRDMPRSIEGYYQEIGRAGRDGLESDCVLFYSWADVMSYDRFTDEAEPEVAEWQRRQARQMFDFADRTGCRHQALVAHFGEGMDACGSACDVCAGTDVVVNARPAGRPDRPERRSAQEAGVEGRRRGAALDATGADEDVELFLALKALRKRLADARGHPAFYVFSDAVLVKMVEERPLTEEALLELPGVGPKKLAAYGAEFLAVLRGARG